MKRLRFGFFDKIRAVLFDQRMCAPRASLGEIDKFINRTKSEAYQKEIAADMKRGYFVYVIQEGEYSKIGVAVDVKNRLKGLQTAHHSDLYILAAWKCSESAIAFYAESAIHRKFSEYHIRGEWFKLPRKLLVQFVNGKLYPLAKNIMERPSDEECHEFADKCLAEGKMGTLLMR